MFPLLVALILSCLNLVKSYRVTVTICLKGLVFQNKISFLLFRICTLNLHSECLSQPESGTVSTDIEINKSKVGGSIVRLCNGLELKLFSF